jgi:hypothetical protein
VELEHHYYSVPYTLTGQSVEIRSTLTTVQIFHRFERAASHRRSHEPYKATTVNEHRLKSHHQHLAWPPSRLLHWAQTVGPGTAQLFTEILKSKPHPEMGYRSCLGILRLGTHYSNERLEGAARRAVSTDPCSYRSVKAILERGLDRQPLETPVARPPAGAFERDTRRIVAPVLVGELLDCSGAVLFVQFLVPPVVVKEGVPLFMVSRKNFLERPAVCRVLVLRDAIEVAQDG